MRRRWKRGALAAGCSLAVLVAAVAAAAGASRAPGGGPRGHAYAPPRGKYFHGVSGTVGRAHAFHQFQHRVRAHPAVMEDFFPWGTSLHDAIPLWRQTRTRGMLSLSTKGGGGAEVITPGQIARGMGDRYIVSLNRSIAASRQIVYIRLMPEMNGYWNPYCAFNSDGSARGNGHSTKSFRKAWRRFAIIVRGGSVRGMDHRLKRLGMSPLKPGALGGARKRLPRPRVAMVWNPQTVGDPAIRGNRPSAYWPGRRYVDWVGADIYAKFATPGIRAALTRFYSRYRGYPFEIGEYSPWDGDPHGRFVKWLFRWSHVHRRARMLVYYRSTYPNSVYDINHYPAARDALRRILDQPRWISYPSGTR
jgi:hypothetical protein